MVIENYSILKNKVYEMNKLNDELSLIEWNKDDGPKFSSVQEMKEFERKLINGELDYLFPGIEEFDTDIIDNQIIEECKLIIDNILFYIYTIKKNNTFITYLSINNNNDVIDKMCGKQSDNRNLAHSHFETLKQSIITNNIDDIIRNLIIGVDRTINKLKNKLQLLASEN